MVDEDYFISLSRELDSLKNRVRGFIKDKHWLTDGEWKESVIRSFLRRNLPETIEVGRGFVITENGPSRQIDILLHQLRQPKLFRDGDLVFVTPDAVTGVIEVKTSIDNSSFREILEKLCSEAQFIRGPGWSRGFIGLFSFENQMTSPEVALKIIQEVVDKEETRIINLVCLGRDLFIRYWNWDPLGTPRTVNSLHAYEIIDQAPGYFIHSVIDVGQKETHGSGWLNKKLWYPKNNLETMKVGSIQILGP